MSHWNYRVVRDTYETGGEYLSFREVYYQDDISDEDIYAWSQWALKPTGDSIDALEDQVLKMHKALTKPVLSIAEMQQELKTKK